LNKQIEAAYFNYVKELMFRLALEQIPSSAGFPPEWGHPFPEHLCQVGFPEHSAAALLGAQGA
jgi:hypothetical protein